MRFTFEFNPLLYRVCNMRTWERLEQMDGLEVENLGVAQEIAYAGRVALCNYVQATFPDGHTMKVVIFNSELTPIFESDEPPTDPSAEG